MHMPHESQTLVSRNNPAQRKTTAYFLTQLTQWRSDGSAGVRAAPGGTC